VQLRIYQNQLTMEYAIFGLVTVIILIALYLAYAQFAVWARRNRNSEMPAVNALTINKEGIAISTPFVGLLMLVAAFAFFYMYVETVYTISDKAESLRVRTENSVYPSGKQESSTAPAVQAANSPADKAAQ
ncbi:MAG TPA: hypothetical protein VL522_00080, partial [Bordetella sp.]|nr:hypothetical protein [Bordetella sp.]